MALERRYLKETDLSQTQRLQLRWVTLTFWRVKTVTPIVFDRAKLPPLPTPKKLRTNQPDTGGLSRQDRTFARTVWNVFEEGVKALDSARTATPLLTVLHLESSHEEERGREMNIPMLSPDGLEELFAFGGVRGAARIARDHAPHSSLRELASECGPKFGFGVEASLNIYLGKTKNPFTTYKSLHATLERVYPGNNDLGAWRFAV